MKPNSLLISIIALFLMYGTACQPESKGEENGAENPKIPTLNSISPTTTLATTVNLLLTVIGSNFTSGSKIFFNGIEKQTIYVSSSELRCTLSSEDTTVGNTSYPLNSTSNSRVVSVFVRNPQSQGNTGPNDSNTLEFTILDNKTFTIPQRISNTDQAGSSDLVLDSSDNIYVRWCSDNGSHLIMSNDTGNSWNVISLNTRVFGESKMVIGLDDHFHIVWINDGVYYSRSTDRGSHWRRPIQLYENGENFYLPHIAAGFAGVVVISWREQTISEKDYRIYTSYSTDFGETWSTPSIFVYGRIHQLHFDRIQHFYFVYDRLTITNRWQVLFIRSLDGINWTGEKVFDGHHAPNIVSDIYGNLSLIYHGAIGITEFSRSTDHGDTWTTPVDIAANPGGFSNYPELSVHIDGSLNVTCMGATENPGVNTDANIFHTQSINNGANWTVPINVSNLPGNYQHPGPKVAVDRQGIVYIIWVLEEEPGKTSVYFTRST
jgi:hypothetical protein